MPVVANGTLRPLALMVPVIVVVLACAAWPSKVVPEMLPAVVVPLPVTLTPEVDPVTVKGQEPVLLV